MTTKQIEHLEESLLKFIDKVMEKQKATPAEIEALPRVALALVQVHKV